MPKKAKNLRSRLYLVLLVTSLIFLWLPSLSYLRFSSRSQPQSAVNQFSAATYQPPPQPQVKPAPLPPLAANYFILLDSATNTVLTAKNPRQRIYPASTTKLATALTALNIYPLSEPISVNYQYQVGKVIDLKLNHQYTAEALISALLIDSANDAAYALANHHPRGLSGFVDQMNQLAAAYQLQNTHFVNVDGIHRPDHYSTVYDLAQLGRLSIKNPTIRQIVKQKTLTITDINGTVSHQLTSTNQLLGSVPQIEGLKTGWTPEAGGCFIGLINLNNHYLISVVAHSSDRFADTQALIDWAQANLTYQPYQP